MQKYDFFLIYKNIFFLFSLWTSLNLSPVKHEKRNMSRMLSHPLSIGCRISRLSSASERKLFFSCSLFGRFTRFSILSSNRPFIEAV